MPKAKRQPIDPAKVIVSPPTREEAAAVTQQVQKDDPDIVQKLGMLFFRHGYSLWRSPKLLRGAGLDPANVTSGLMNAAEEWSRGELRRRWLAHNEDPNRAFDCIIVGDPAFSGGSLVSCRPVKGQEKDSMPKAKTTAQEPKKGKAKTASATTKPEANGGARGARYTVLGHPATAVVRWMGKAGWEFEAARKALNKLGGKDLADATVRIQLRAGAKGERGDPAALSKKEVEELKKAAK